MEVERHAAQRAIDLRDLGRLEDSRQPGHREPGTGQFPGRAAKNLVCGRGVGRRQRATANDLRHRANRSHRRSVSRMPRDLLNSVEPSMGSTTRVGRRESGQEQRPIERDQLPGVLGRAGMPTDLFLEIRLRRRG